MFAAPVNLEQSPDYTKTLYKGVYLGDFNSDWHIWQSNDISRSYFTIEELNSYGVCDTPKQFFDKFGRLIAKDERPICLVFTHIKKEPEKAFTRGGWRWHKWGPYVGEYEPTTEYLDDEQEFCDGVFVYHLYIVDNVEVI